MNETLEEVLLFLVFVCINFIDLAIKLCFFNKIKKKDEFFKKNIVLD